MRTDPIRAPQAGATPFALWIRTGRWVPAQLADAALEVKFNPHHDPNDGRFTFKDSGIGSGQQRPSGRRPATNKGSRGGDGSWDGGGLPGGGGGSFSGAGATGHGYWMNHTEVRASRARFPGLDLHMVTPGETLDQIAASRHVTIASIRQLNGLSSDAMLKPGQVLVLPKVGGNLQRVERNGYFFGIDSVHRTYEAKGGLYLAGKQQRSKASQRQAGGADRRATDDGGHFIAARFGGPSDSFNHFAQDSNLNRGIYRAIEDDWAKQLRAGKHVSVDILAYYAGTSRRPGNLDVLWSVNGHPHSQKLFNEPRGKKHVR